MSDNNQTDRRGINLTDRRILEAGLIFREQSISDNGIDAQIEIKIDEKATGRLIAVQIKTGPTWFKEEDKNKTGFWHRFCDRHKRLWVEHSLPVIIVLCDIESDTCYYELVTEKNCINTGKKWKIFIPKNKTLTASSRDDLIGISSVIDRNFKKLFYKSEVGNIDIDPLDGELEIFQKFVEAEKFQTVLDLLPEHFDDPNRSSQISPTIKARILSLQGVCLKSLDQLDEVSKYFLKAFATDPDNPKIRNNAAIGYLIKMDFDAALDLLEQLIKNEPEEPMYWANLICAKSHKDEVMDLKKIPEVVQKDKNVLLALVNIKRQKDDFTWIQIAIETANLYPESRRARRHEAEAAIDLIINPFVSDELSATQRTSILLKAKKATVELGKQWADHLNTEASKSFLDIALLQNTLIAHRVIGNDAEVATLIKAHEDVLLLDDDAKRVLGGYALDNNDEELLDKVLAKDFNGSAFIRFNKALRDMEWTEALIICESYREEIRSAGWIDPVFAGDVLRAILLEGSKQTAAFEDIFSQKSKHDPKNDLFLYQVASKSGIQNVANIAFNRALIADIGTDTKLRCMLAGEAMKQDMYDEVIYLLATFVDPTWDDITRKRLAISYASTSSPDETGIAFFDAIRSADNADAELNFAGGQFYLNRRQPAEAIPWFRKSLDLEPTNVRTQLAYLEALNFLV